jgi:subtilisin family serine protease
LRRPRGSAAPAIACAAALLGASIALAAPAPGRGGPDVPGREAWRDPRALLGVDPRLIAAAASPETVAVWLGLRDKGEAGPAELAAALARARASLTPRSLARRLRARVEPLVDYRDLPVHGPYLDSLVARGLAPFGAQRWLNQVAVRLPGARLPEVAALPFVDRVREVEPRFRSADPVGPPGPAPESPARASRTGLAGAIAYGLTAEPLAQLGLPAVHDSGYVGTGVLICVLDEGFNAHDTHEALRDVPFPPGFRRDFVEGDTIVTNLSDPVGFEHGTWVLGLLAGNRPGVYVGAAFGASYALGRTEVHASEHRIEMIYWGMGAEWADSIGADVISSSLGYSTFESPDPSYTYADMDGHTTIVSRAAEIAASKGILVVNAVGNEGNGPWGRLVAPADVDGDSLIAVGAVDASGTVADFSSRGPSADGRVKPDLAARGRWSPLVSPAGGPTAYEAQSGTSFAAPLVAGLAACLMQARPAWRPVDVSRALRGTASRACAPDNEIGYGIPDGLAALAWDPASGDPPPCRRPAPAAEVLGPNPLRADGPATRVRFTAGGFSSGPQAARARVYDVQGRIVRELWSGSLAHGQYAIVAWDGRGDDRRKAASGIYFVALEAGGQRAAARVALLR